ncbi:MAG: sortase [Clostridiales bacterium]|jgi:sortase A|nr:sortase [Clostridiales bacterium]MCI1961463.1 sortase [Clostridiales bacterium]MCI2022128.1 sortase [Clostridiales bacterium]MCI2025857.1 sortase [Clostridiales bacterium]MCI2160716.1 sortase [Oscillospiraceae bacterium]
MTKKVGIVVMIFGTALITAAALLLLYNHYEDQRAGETAQALVPEIKQAINEDDTGNETDIGMTALEIDGYDYIGYLSIPTLNLELPVMSEWDYSRLKIAPCRQYGSLWTNDLVIAGHNYSRHFGSFSALELGDAVAFTDMNGDTVDYSVKDVKILQPTDADWVEHSGFDLILYTCTYSGETRIVVCCNRLEKK